MEEPEVAVPSEEGAAEEESAAGAAGAAEEDSAAGAAGAADSVVAAGALSVVEVDSSFLPQADRETARRAARRTEYFIIFPLIKVDKPIPIGQGLEIQPTAGF